jgi:predicted 2-oxoglutarate/Fe(II)-dependent dioxygenase YbiX
VITHLPQTVEGLFTPDECRDLRREIDAALTWEAEARTGDVVSASRLGRIAALAESTERYVHDRLWELVPQVAVIYNYEVAELTAARALTHRAGDDVAAHADGGVGDDVDPEVARRRVSLVVALNDGDGDEPDFTGGQLRLYPKTPPGEVPPPTANIVELRSRPGTLIAFPSPMVHRVMPVTSGCRYSLALWALAPAG